MKVTAEQNRLEQSWSGAQPWLRWGPYLSERQWGTVREDYSRDGSAWEYLPHDQARSVAYRWGEDGLAGICDDKQLLCLSVGLWNGVDPILKERLFGLNGHEGNHGEDVKELYYYLDNTPTHAYMKYLYKYPQSPFPYAKLVAENARRGRAAFEYEILDTGVFADNRYFDVFVEYAKAAPEDLVIRISAYNRAAQAADFYGLLNIWFRNTWMWQSSVEKPSLQRVAENLIEAEHPQLGRYLLACGPQAQLLFCENETNYRRLGRNPGSAAYFKDGINNFLVNGDRSAVNPNLSGTKAALLYRKTIAPGECAIFNFRFWKEATDQERSRNDSPEAISLKVDGVLTERRQEADAFYDELQEQIKDPDAKRIQRQALAGMLWSKQFYCYDVQQWLTSFPDQPQAKPPRDNPRNKDWAHLNNSEIISMPDKWEYPWYAAWDLAFHCIALALVDRQFAKDQLVLITREWYMHPNGQLPAYEWNFSDVNPPVHAWAAWRVYQIDRNLNQGRCDLAFLERVFHKLLLNFTWWVNRKDPRGKNIFQGGFLGLDNIGVFNRSEALPTGGYISQADGTSWMAMYCLNLMRIALELALHNRVYEDIATKFFEHFLLIAGAINNLDTEERGLWDEDDEFFYDRLTLPDGSSTPLKVRSMVGLIPLFAVETLEPELLARLPEFNARLEWYLKYRPDLASLVSRWNEPGRGERRLLSLLRGHRMKCVLRRMLDEKEFLSPHGVRALSKYHLHNPYRYDSNQTSLKVDYEPAESQSGLFGGNSNWRGPVWFPVNYLIIESLQKFHHYYGDDFKIEHPTGSGKFCTINEIADDLSQRLVRLFLRDADGKRPIFGAQSKLQEDQNFRDHLLFHEYFHGDIGAGIGAMHQTGWTGLVAKLIQPRRPARACFNK